MSVFTILIVAALVIAILSAVKPYPILWVAVVLICILLMVERFPGLR